MNINSEAWINSNQISLRREKLNFETLFQKDQKYDHLRGELERTLNMTVNLEVSYSIRENVLNGN